MKKEEASTMQVRDVTPEKTEEEVKEAATYIVESVSKLFTKGGTA